MRRLALLFALTGACVDTSETCPGDQPVQLAQRDIFLPRLETSRIADRSLVRISLTNTDAETLGVGACGDEAVHLADAWLVPLRERLALPELDLSLMCDTDTQTLLHIDLEDMSTPEPVLPDYACPTTASPRGPLAFTRGSPGEPTPLWLLPNFPAATDAVQVSPPISRDDLAVRGDALFYRTPDDQLHRRELTKGDTDELLATDVLDFDTTATHLLTTGLGVPSLLLSLTDDTELELPAAGLDAWRFATDSSYLLRTTLDPDDGLQFAAFDLNGQELTLPAGQVMHQLSDGRLLIDRPDGQTLLVRPGERSIELDLTYSDIDDLQESGDYLEILLHDELWYVPLDGGDAEYGGSGVGRTRLWLSDDRLLTAYAGELVRIDLAADGERRVLAHDVQAFVPAPDGGVYYIVAGLPEGDAREGLWYLPPGRLKE